MVANYLEQSVAAKKIKSAKTQQYLYCMFTGGATGSNSQFLDHVQGIPDLPTCTHFEYLVRVLTSKYAGTS